MKILHVANVRNRPQSGITNAVPKHIFYQVPYASVALLNITPFVPDGTSGAFETYFFSDYRNIGALPDGFSSPDLVVFHEIYWPGFIGLSKYLSKNDIPYIVIPHGSSTRIAQSQKRLKKMIGNVLVFNRFIRNATAIQYLSDFDREQTVFPGIPSITQGSGIVSRNEKKVGFSESGLRLIYVGRLDVTVKGLDLMVETARRYKQEFIRNKVLVTIAGSDDRGEAELRSLIDTYDLEDIISLQPPIYGDQKIKKILQHDVFFQLSRTEAQCLGLMEAMDLGMPSIVSRGTSLFDAAKNYHVGIPVESDADSIYIAIVSILENRHRLPGIGERASDYVKSNYDWDVVGSAMVNKYRSLLGDK